MDKVNTEIEGIKEQIEVLTDRLEKLNSTGKEQVAQDIRRYIDSSREYIGQTVDSLKEHGKEAKDTMGRGARTTDRYVHDNPWAVVLGAAAVGMIIGMFSRNHRD